MHQRGRGFDPGEKAAAARRAAGDGHGDAGRTAPQVFTHIKLTYAVSGRLSRKAVEDAVALSKNKYCSVGQMLEKAAAVEHEIVFEDGEPEA